MQDIMGNMDIAFPNLGIYLRDVPKSFSVFGFTIALYGVIIAIGVLGGVLLAAHVAKLEGLDADLIWDFAIYAIIFSIIGARIYYVVLTLWIYCRRKKQSFLQIADICVPGLVLGQIIGRWGNFTNREVFGEYTDNLLAMRLPAQMVRTADISETIAAHMAEGTNYIQVHPTFLYESLWNLALLCIWAVTVWEERGLKGYAPTPCLFPIQP